MVQHAADRSPGKTICLQHGFKILSAYSEGNNFTVIWRWFKQIIPLLQTKRRSFWRVPCVGNAQCTVLLRRSWHATRPIPSTTLAYTSGDASEQRARWNKASTGTQTLDHTRWYCRRRQGASKVAQASAAEDERSQCYINGPQWQCQWQDQVVQTLRPTPVQTSITLQRLSDSKAYG